MSLLIVFQSHISLHFTVSPETLHGNENHEAESQSRARLTPTPAQLILAEKAVRYIPSSTCIGSLALQVKQVLSKACVKS